MLSQPVLQSDSLHHFLPHAEADFVGSALVGESAGSSGGDDDKIYFFFTERSQELTTTYSHSRVARVARICKVSTACWQSLLDLLYTSLTESFLKWLDNDHYCSHYWTNQFYSCHSHKNAFSINCWLMQHIGSLIRAMFLTLNSCQRGSGVQRNCFVQQKKLSLPFSFPPHNVNRSATPAKTAVSAI